MVLIDFVQESMAVGKNKSFSKRGAGAKRRAVDAFAKKGNYLGHIFIQ